MPYFRVGPGVPNDLTLLPKELRDHSDIANIAANAEADVIAHYTRQEAHDDATQLDAGTVAERYVWLRGYEEDDGDALAAFATAMRRAIANVIRWQIARDRKTPNVVFEGGEPGTTGKTFRTDAESKLPGGFDAPLRSFVIVLSPMYY